MGAQSPAKTLFLLASMVGWLLVGAVLMYLFPFLANVLVHSDRTTLWLTNLSRSGYYPGLGMAALVVLLAIEILANWIWYSRFEQR